MLATTRFHLKRPLTLTFLPALFLIYQPAAAQMSANDAALTRAYVTDERGQVITSESGLCWRTGYWTPALAASDPAGCACDREWLPERACATGAVPPPPPPPAPRPSAEKLTLSAEVLFDSGKAVLRPEAKARLSQLAQRARDLALEVIVVVGHSDRSEGSQAAAARLAQSRASAVKEFLVSLGVAPGKIYSEGKGKTQPVSGATCAGLAGAKARQCLQPDRRVEIEVIGSRRSPEGGQKVAIDPDKLDCRAACEAAEGSCWNESSARRDDCVATASVKSKCYANFNREVSRCSADRLDCASHCVGD